MEFPGLLIEETISMYYPTTKKEVEFSGPLEIPGRDVQDRATPGGISIGLDFDLGISKGVTQFCRVSRSESLFSPEFLCNDLMIHHDIMIVYK